MSSLLRLTEIIGRTVVADGRRIGRACDVAARGGETTPSVTTLLVRERRRTPPVAVPVSAVAEFGDPIRLRAGAEPEDWRLAPDELLLARDVLDAQIVDTRGKRLVRVGDVEIAREPGEVLVVAGVEVGAAGVVRRLGLRRLARRIRVQTVAWEHIHVAHGRGHELLLESPTSAVRRLGPDELAEVVERLTVARAAEVLDAADPSTAAAVIERSSPDTAAALRKHREQGA